MIVRIVLAVWVLSAAGSAQDAPPPNIIWINAEDIGPAFGCYGDAYATTPNIDRLAEGSLVYRNAYATAPICAPARSCLITGVYATTLGTEHLRMEVDKPDFIETVPEYLREGAGYFTTNYGKTDFNFSPEGVWDYWKQDLAPWRQAPEGRPFFSMFTLGQTHEGRGNSIERYREVAAELPDSLVHDPKEAPVPPYYPDTPETRALWARYYDLITHFDREVGKVLDALAEDGLLDNTFVFVFADHGFGMPRYKRWLYKTGLHVPLVVHVPERYRHLAPRAPGSETDRLVSFVDFAPSVLRLAGVAVPEHMQGSAFLGEEPAAPRDYVFGARSRADDMYEMSRAVLDDRYIYIRHFMPHLPYIQPGVISGDQKEAYRLLRAHHQAGTLHAEGEKMWSPKPVEELYDLTDDPYELNNLAESPAYDTVKTRLRDRLYDWMVATRDLGLLYESDMLLRAVGRTPYGVGRDTGSFRPAEVLAAARRVGEAPQLDLLSADDSAIRFWGLVALRQQRTLTAEERTAVLPLLNDPSPAVQLQAAEVVCLTGDCTPAYPVYRRWLADERNWVALQAARSLQLIGEGACPLVPEVYEKLRALRNPPGSRRVYTDFNYASFTGWALEPVLEACGAGVRD
jgi:arylsulfatase A-like enzyme